MECVSLACTAISMAISVASRPNRVENLMMGFRLSEGIRQVTFKKRFESDLAQALGGLWSEWTTRGLVLKRPGRYALSRRGRMILNRLLLEIQERVPREQWESGRCRWP